MTEQPTIYRRTGLATAVGILSALYALTFLVGALLHLGWRIPLGFTVLAEPKILVEGLCGLALAAAAIAVFTACVGPGRLPSQPTPSPLEVFCSAWARWP